MKYTIERESHFNRKSIEHDIIFHIKYRKTFFGFFDYWKYIKHKDCDPHGCVSVKTTFRTEEEAIKYAEILCKGTNRNTTVITDIKTIECNQS